ncbi:glycosyltransferase [Bacillus sonorensis]|uniref:Glycosyltransferase YkoN n=2 Tax=Bacillus sonorensis TaxID=119858 RepID=M5NY04_9BACI|nr:MULTISPECIES: glycosyltransferase YkoN [Bacillus]TWK85451.1 Processive diacylglycerol beta-glucosyltransferase [Bacillus paralicheniformis]ASB90519.1 1,2-diacylglycerol 3-glucosyltransferase [Bacillus sonorensis]EME72119.1 glycosyltransferase YkoN [Bacillus sonorensis L12]MBG9915219.1 glycosyltransferase [Bacillus sonorensis]MCF7619679.1 glycosyltransferase [Bacillus sonorensis]
MTTILIFPFLSISTGHHHVADSLHAELSLQAHQCEKIDIFSHAYKKLEKVSSTAYLKWIQYFPKAYSSVYHLLACGKHQAKKRHIMYELIFLKNMKQIIAEKQPDIAFCTHALPSYLLNQLKDQFPNLIVVNVYTDYFVNRIWGREHTDYHFAPIKDIKDQLIAEGVDKEKIFLTGIPIDRSYKTASELVRKKEKGNILVTGGSMGVGGMFKLVRELSPQGNMTYQILCGKNRKLYQYVKSLHHPDIKALPYIESKSEMNRLYGQASGIITKPGGVTISECIEKKLPVFIYHALPGQEEMNLSLLKKKGLVIELNKGKKQPIEQQLLAFFNSKEGIRRHHMHVSQYLQETSDRNISKILDEIIHNSKKAGNANA